MVNVAEDSNRRERHNPALTLTRLPLRCSLREGAAKYPCQPGHGSLLPGRLRHRWVAEVLQNAGY